MESSRGWCQLADAYTVIATAFRALAIGHDIVNFADDLPPLSVEEFHEISMFSSPEYIGGDDPKIRASRVKKIPKKDASKESKLRELVREMHRITLRMLCRGQPEELPIILCVLCIMRLVQYSIQTFTPIMRTIITREYNALWAGYCGAFHHLASSFHPLVGEWDKTPYESLLGEDHIMSSSYFTELHKIWVHDGRCFSGTY